MKIAYLICISLVLGSISCSKKVTQEELISAALELRLEQWKKEELEKCKIKSLDKAEAYVDSFLIAISLSMKLDTIPKPGKPIKPEKPIFKETPDSLVPRQILKGKE